MTRGAGRLGGEQLGNGRQVDETLTERVAGPELVVSDRPLRDDDGPHTRYERPLVAVVEAIEVLLAFDVDAGVGCHRGRLWRTVATARLQPKLQPNGG